MTGRDGLGFSLDEMRRGAWLTRKALIDTERAVGISLYTTFDATAFAIGAESSQIVATSCRIRLDDEIDEAMEPWYSWAGA